MRSNIVCSCRWQSTQTHWMNPDVLSSPLKHLEAGQYILTTGVYVTPMSFVVHRSISSCYTSLTSHFRRSNCMLLSMKLCNIVIFNSAPCKSGVARVRKVTLNPFHTSQILHYHICIQLLVTSPSMILKVKREFWWENKDVILESLTFCWTARVQVVVMHLISLKFAVYQMSCRLQQTPQGLTQSIP